MINFSLAPKGNPADVDAEKKYFAVAQYQEFVDIEEFASHIANHGQKWSRSDIAAVLSTAVDCMQEMLLLGSKIELGDLGSFTVNLKSRGESNPADFNSAINIKRVAVKWTPGKMFKDLKEKAKFQQVPSRRIQAETLKQINGEKTKA